ncbi:MAG: hypothetical protein ABR526_08535 [Chthoniobacterales bacterium]
MNISTRTALVALCGAFVCNAYAVEPPAVEVVVRDHVGKPIHKQMVPANGIFETDRLEGGTYTVFFKAAGAGLKGAQYALFVNAGKNKVTEDALAGERLEGAGVALNIYVPSTCNIVGQVANGQAMRGDKLVFKVKIVNGHRYVWQKPSIDSNIAGHWVPDGLAEGHEIVHMGQEWLRQQQDRVVPFGH